MSACALAPSPQAAISRSRTSAPTAARRFPTSARPASGWPAGRSSGGSYTAARPSAARRCRAASSATWSVRSTSPTSRNGRPSSRTSFWTTDGALEQLQVAVDLPLRDLVVPLVELVLLRLHVVVHVVLARG